MTRAIWKFTLEPGDQTVEMPRNAKLVHVGAQGNECCVWFEVAPESERIARAFRVVMTGEEYDDSLGFMPLGTAQLACGIVAHVLGSIS